MNRYFARDGSVYVKVEGEAPRQVTTAITTRGRELERFERAALKARCQLLSQTELVEIVYNYDSSISDAMRLAAFDEYDHRNAGVPDE